jgi:hypothetical protein
MADRFFENLAKFKYLGMTVTIQYLSHEEIKSRLNSGKVEWGKSMNGASVLVRCDFEDVTPMAMRAHYSPYGFRRLLRRS